MTRPRQYVERIQINARLPKPLHELLVQAAEQRQVSANYLIEIALTGYLNEPAPAAQPATPSQSPADGLPPRSPHWPHEPTP